MYACARTTLAAALASDNPVRSCNLSRGGLAAAATAACFIAGCVSTAFGQFWPGQVEQFGSAGDDEVAGMLANGDRLIIAGNTRGTLGAPNHGGIDVFLHRNYPSYTRQFGSSADDVVLAIGREEADPQAGTLIAGYTRGDLVTGGHLGGADIFVARYTYGGVREWLHQFGTAQDDIARAIVVSPDGGFFLAGSTAGDLGGTSAGGLDAFIARYDSAGMQVWLRQFGGAGDDAANGLALAPSGGVYIVGDFTTAASGTDIFLARYDSAGNELWRRDFGSAADDHARAITFIYPTNDIAIGGSTAGDLGGPSAGGRDAWLARFDSAGQRPWLLQFGTPEDDEINALMHSGNSTIGAAGATWGTLDPATPNAGGSDAFLAVISASGVFHWAWQFGTPEDDAATALARGFMIAGHTDGQLGWHSTGSRDVFYTGAVAGCYPDCDISLSAWGLNVDDFTCFINEFAHAQSFPHAQQLTAYANCDGSTVVPVLNVDDFMCFLNAFAYGCN